MHVTNVAKMTHLKEKYQGQLCGLPNFLFSGYQVLSGCTINSASNIN